MEERAMNLSRPSLLALSVVLSSALASSCACAQTNNDQQYELKPFLPPLLPLPPNAQVNPGSLTIVPESGRPAPLINSSPTEPPRAPGLTITVPTTTR